MTNPHYSLHGLVIKSDVDLPGVTIAPKQEARDISVISAQENAQWSWENQNPDHWIHVSPDHNHVRLDVPDCATFFVSSGHLIEYDRVQRSALSALQAYLLGNALGAALYQRGHFPLHASAVAFDQGAVLFVGDRGAGKSTLSAFAKKHGAAIIADDVSNVVIENQNCLVPPAIQRSKLHQDSLASLGFNTDKLDPVDGQEGKFFTSATEMISRARPIKAIVELAPSNQPTPQLNPLARLESLSLLRRHNYNFALVDALGRQQEFLDFAAKASQMTDFYRLSFPHSFDALPNVFSMLDERFN